MFFIAYFIISMINWEESLIEKLTWKMNINLRSVSFTCINDQGIGYLMKLLDKNILFPLTC